MLRGSGIQIFFTAAEAGWHRGGYSRMPRVMSGWGQPLGWRKRHRKIRGAGRSNGGARQAAQALAKTENLFCVWPKPGATGAHHKLKIGGWLVTAAAAPARSIRKPRPRHTRQTGAGRTQEENTAHCGGGWGWHAARPSQQSSQQAQAIGRMARKSTGRVRRGRQLAVRG